MGLIPSENNLGNRPVRIGVVDTGVTPERLPFGRVAIQGIGIDWTSGAYRYSEGFQDLAGHGTGVACRILSFCRTAEICAVRIARQEGERIRVQVEEQVLAMGIDWCIENEVKIINVSYCIATAAPGGVLDKVCRKVYDRGGSSLAPTEKSGGDMAFRQGIRT